MDSSLRKREQGIEAFVRYRLSAATYQRALAEYKMIHKAFGMELGRYFPALESTLRSEAEVVVLSVEKGSPADEQGIRAGDLVRSLGGSPVPSIDALKSRLGAPASAPADGEIVLEIESAGAKRAVRFARAAGP
jgi:S1-C subfamily serine protease